MKTPSALLGSLFILLCTFNSNEIIGAPSGAIQILCQTVNIQMYDSYGDGWNGGVLAIYDVQGNLDWIGWLENGSAATYTACLDPGCYTVFVDPGSFPAEISWDIDDGTYWLAGGGAPTQTTFQLGNLITGCTDPNACNYNSSANCMDEGSCIYGNCYKLEMMDSGGNGWGGYSLILVDNLGVVAMNETLANGSYGIATGSLPHEGCYFMNSNGPPSPGNSEISWNLYYKYDYYGYFQLVSSSGDFEPFPFFCSVGCVEESAANYSPFHWQNYADYEKCCFENKCIIGLENFAVSNNIPGAFTITNNQDEQVAQGKLLMYQEVGHFEFCFPDGCYTLHVTPFQDGGSADVQWEIETSDFYWNGTGETSYTFALGTIVEGCTHPDASNYDPMANCDNNVCFYNCDSDLDGNGLINIVDLLIFTSEFGNSCE